MATHEYPQKDLTIIWQPEKCIHAGVCVKMLPKVYNPRARPWINPDAAEAEQLIQQINACPSGALSYRMNE